MSDIVLGAIGISLSFIGGGLAVAWRLGALSQRVEDLVDRFDRHEISHNGKVPFTIDKTCSFDARHVHGTVICPRCGGFVG